MFSSMLLLLLPVSPLCFLLAGCFRCRFLSLSPSNHFLFKELEKNSALLLCCECQCWVSTTTKESGNGGPRAQRWRRSQMRSEEIERVRQKTAEKKLVFSSSSAGVESRESIQMVARNCVCFFHSEGQDLLQDLRHDNEELSFFHLFFIETLTPHRHITSVFLPLSLLLKILFSSSCSRRRHKKKLYTCTA